MIPLFSPVDKQYPNISFLLCRYVAKRRANVKRHRTTSSSHPQGAEQRKIQQQFDLTKTLSVTVLAFVLCLSPYGITTLLHLENTNPLIKKVNFQMSKCREFLLKKTTRFKS